ncbi:MAG TPA: hypothetical protein DCL31_05660 [Clostridium sp.]|nr:hypothetical protein [Clostridium sp.]
MLLLKGNKLMNWKRVYSIMLLRLVDESCKWSNEVIERVENKDIEVCRNKYIKRCIDEKKILFIEN